jgi:hypothetical protein
MSDEQDPMGDNLLKIIFGTSMLLAIIATITLILTSYRSTNDPLSDLPVDPCVTQECKDQLYYLNLFNNN